MSRGACRSDATQRRFQAKGEGCLVLRVRVPRDDERQRLENGPNGRGVVFTEGTRRDERTHVEKPVRPVCRIAIDDAQIWPDGFGGIERHRQREEEATRRGLQRGVGRGEELLDELVERAVGIVELLGDAGVNLTCSVPDVELSQVLQSVPDIGERDLRVVERGRTVWCIVGHDDGRLLPNWTAWPDRVTTL